MNVDSRISMMIMSKLCGGVLFGGDNGDILHDGFKSLDYVDLSKCVNADFSTVGKILPGLSGETTADPTTTSGIGTFTMFNKSFSLDAGKTVSKIGIYSNVSGSMTLKIGLRVSSTSYTIVLSQNVSHNGSGWVDFDLTSPFVVPATGDYYVGQYVSWTTCPVVLNQPRAWVSGNATGTISVTEHASNNAPAVRVSYSSSSNMTVVGAPVEHSGFPEEASIIIFSTGTATMAAAVSRDGGTSWSTGTPSLLFTQADGSKVYHADSIDLTSQPSGMSVVWKVEATVGLLGLSLEAV